MAAKDLKKWTAFFQDAGVPRGPAGEYATLFCDHRIKDALLGDLTKEILNDIGITVMGDVMCILKHSKAVYAKFEREKSSNQLVQYLESVDKFGKKDDLAIISGSQVKKKKRLIAKPPSKAKTDVQQMTVVATTTSKKTSPTPEPKKTMTVNDLTAVQKKRPAKSTMTLSERFTNDIGPKPKNSRVSLETSQTEISTLKKVPSKTMHSPEWSTYTEKGVTNVSAKRKSAFERLGKEEPNTSLKDTKDLSPKIKISKVAKSPVTASSSKATSKNESSVFKRLGETEAASPLLSAHTGALTICTTRSTGFRIVSDDSEDKLQKSHSVLRPLKPIRPVQPVKPVSPIKAPVFASTTKESSRKSVFSRLGSQS